MPFAEDGSILASAVGTIGSRKLFSVRVHHPAQDTLATDRESLLALFAALGTALAQLLRLLGQGTVEHWTCLFYAFQASILALALQTGIFTRSHLATLQHRLAVVFASWWDWRERERELNNCRWRKLRRWLTDTRGTALVGVRTRRRERRTGGVTLQVHLRYNAGETLVVEARIVWVRPLRATLMAGAIKVAF